MYHHFAFFAVSLAMFGLALAGAFASLRPALRDPTALSDLAERYSLYAAGSTVIALVVLLRQHVGLDLAAGNLWTLSLIYLIAAVPFFFAGLVVTLAITHLRHDIRRVYFADLVGAALGCVLLVPLMDALGGPATVLASAGLYVAAHLAWVAARPRAQRTRWRWLAGLVPLVAALSLVALEAGVGLFPFPSAKDTLEDRVVFSQWTSSARVTVEQSHADWLWMKIDSSAATRIFPGTLAASHWAATRRFSEIRLASLAYALPDRGRVLIVGPGGGADVISALHHGRTDITAVEVNPVIANTVMREHFRDYSGALYERPEVRLVVADGRAFVRADEQHYAIIQATLVDTWAATAAGAFALAENALYTREAFVDFLRHLEPHGVLSFTRWSPPRELLRLIALGRAALDEMGVVDHPPHFYVAQDARLATVLIKRTPFTADETRALDNYVRAAGLSRVFPPDANPQSAVVELIRTPSWQRFVAAFPRDIAPPTDDRPFFFYTVRPDRLLAALAEPRALSRQDLGLALLVFALVVAAALVLALLVAPLFLFRRNLLAGQLGHKLRHLGYFAAIGAGFITLEMVFLQKLVLVLGHPTAALVVVLFTLLLASGVGSLYAGGRPPTRAIRRNVAGLAALLLFYLVALDPVLSLVAGAPLMIRVGAAVLVIAPLGFLLGSFLPLGIAATEDALAPLLPWAWGVNGATSVLGSILAVGLAMHVGFSITLVVGLACYVLAGGLAPGRKARGSGGLPA